MTRSISRVRTRVAFPTAPHECDEVLEAGHETGRGLVGPPYGYAPCQAEQVLELVGRDKKLLRRQVHQGTQRRQHHELGSRFVAPEALGRVDEPAEPREDAEKHLAHGFASLAVAAATAAAKITPSK